MLYFLIMPLSVLRRPEVCFHLLSLSFSIVMLIRLLSVPLRERNKNLKLEKIGRLYNTAKQYNENLEQ
jgi:hypothetical protein